MKQKTTAQSSVPETWVQEPPEELEQLAQWEERNYYLVTTISKGVTSFKRIMQAFLFSNGTVNLELAGGEDKVVDKDAVILSVKKGW